MCDLYETTYKHYKYKATMIDKPIVKYWSIEDINDVSKTDPPLRINIEYAGDNCVFVTKETNKISVLDAIKKRGVFGLIKELKYQKELRALINE